MSQCLIYTRRPLSRYVAVTIGYFCLSQLLLSKVMQVHSFVFNTPPIFPSQRDHYIYEDSPIDTLVLTAKAQDDGPLVYSIGQSVYKDGSKLFRINNRTADIFLNESLLGKAGQQLYFYVQAFDGEHKSKIEICFHIQAKNNSAKKPDLTTANKGKSVLPVLEAARHSPNSTWLIPPTSSTTKPTLSPVQPPPTADPLNNPNRKNVKSNSESNESEHSWNSSNLNESKSSGAAVSSDSLATQSVLSNLPLYLLLLCFVPFVCLVAWTIYKCQRNVPTRNAIKTFSHKIINNNKSDSNETTASSFSSETDYNGALFRSKKSTATKEMSANSNRSLLKVTENEWDFPRHHLKFIHILGEGCFGQVWKCEAMNIGANSIGGSQVVAVKTLKQNASEKEKNDLLEELEVMKMLDQHPNVVTLIGCCAEQDPVLLIMEFIPNGTLQNCLRESRPDYGNIHGHSRLTSRDLISFAYQISKGMEYLSSKGVIHRDLAARNVLVSHNKVCKIADFGFAKYDEIYERKSEGRLPIRWMAVESLNDSIFTTKSDVWSFGILMWEIVTLGWTPYPGFSANEVVKKVTDGFRLEKPEHCKREMFNIMYYCWDKEPNKRPSFSELVTLLDNILYSENDYIELDRFPDHAYYNILKPVLDEKL